MSAVTLGSLFAFSGVDIEHGLAEAAKDSSNKTVAAGWTSFATDTVVAQLNEALKIDVFELFAEAWAKFRQVQDCADQRKHPLGETAIVRLNDIEISSTNTPFLQASVDGVALPELKLNLELVAKFEALELVICDARIRALRPGAASALVCLKYGKTKLADKSTPHWNLPGEIKMPGEGIMIARASG